MADIVSDIVTGAATPILQGVEGIITAIFGNKEETDKAKVAQAVQLINGQLQIQLAQIAANTAASQKEVFTFRDGAGWICVVGLGVTVLRPLVQWGCTLAGHPVVLPAMDTSETTPMLLSLLGLGGMHAYQKVNS